MIRLTQKRSSRGNKKLKIAAFLFTLIVIFSCVLFVTQRAEAPIHNDSENIESKASPPDGVAGRYLFNGTIVLARAVERAAKTDNGYDYDQPFSGLDTLKPEKYDAWSADLECPVTDSTISYAEQIANTIFNCRVEFLPALHKYFDIVNLANNHTNDMGADGLSETQTHLAAAGIQSFGTFDPTTAQDICEVVALPVRVHHKDTSETKGSLPVAFCAWHYYSRNPGSGEIEVMKRYEERMPVFGFMHAGAEYVAKAGAEQQNIAHSIIDLGAEFVIGNSPHWVQDSEVYKGKPIFYSTGNFIFDELDYETQRGLSVDITMDVSYDDNVAKWLSLGVECKPLNDTCIETARAQDLQKVKLALMFAPIATSGGNKKVTRKGDGALQAAIEDRLNWASTLKALKQ